MKEKKNKICPGFNFFYQAFILLVCTNDKETRCLLICYEGNVLVKQKKSLLSSGLLCQEVV